MRIIFYCSSWDKQAALVENRHTSAGMVPFGELFRGQESGTQQPAPLFAFYTGTEEHLGMGHRFSHL